MDDFNPVLRDLHTYQLRIQSVTEELEEGPRRLKRQQNKIAAAEKALADHLAAIKGLKVEINDREVSVKANTDKMNKHKRDLDGISSKKEYDALNVEIASLKTRNVALEDEAFARMTQVEEMTAKVPTFEAAVAKAKDESAKAEAEHQAQLPAWQARLDEAKQIVQEKIKLLPEEWIRAFRRLEETQGADTLAPLTGRSCSSCYTEVTAQQFTMIKSGRINTCKNCGKILYVAE
jgi:predicted  nucleic acid-binding Zn-ribbon protein